MASDGALMLADGTSLQPDRGLRAIVPADSTRPRIAPTQGAFLDFAHGRVGYLAGAPGTVSADVLRRGAVVLHAQAQVSAAGEGQLTLPGVPEPGRYRLQLRLATPSGGSQSRALIDTRLSRISSGRVSNGSSIVAVPHVVGSRVEEHGLSLLGVR